MSLLKVTPAQKRSLGIATVLAIVAGAWFLRNYLMLIAIAAIIAYLFTPFYEWLIRKGRGKGQAALLTFLASLLAIIIPLSIVIVMTVLQVNHLLTQVSDQGFSVDTTELLNNFVVYFNNTMQNFGISVRLSTEQITSTISTAFSDALHLLVSSIVSSLSGIFGLITTSIIYIYVFMSITTKRDKIIELISKLNPLGREVSELYLDRMGLMTKATVRGQFIIALCQGLASAIGLAIAGMPELFFFFLVLLTILSVVPLGAGIVTIPIGIIMILTGNVWQGVLVIANHLLIVTNIDNVLRPQLVPKNARLDSALMMLSVFAGIGIFGFFGIVLGPVLMIVIITTLQMFMEVYRDTESLSRNKNTTQGKSFFGKITAMFQRG